MKRFASFILTLILFLGLPTISRAEHKSTSTGVYRQTLLNGITDTLATLGKSDQEKAAIRKQRHMARTNARLKKLKDERHQRIIQR
jgi:hypothetical protein